MCKAGQQLCGYCEREYVKKVAGYRTVLEIECMHCRTIYGHKDGFGKIGKTHGICPPCKEKGLEYVIHQKGTKL
jgi:hypothetical protein